MKTTDLKENRKAIIMKKESKKSAKKEQYKTRRIKFETGWLIMTYKVTE